jgi:hypothetical protein
MYLNIFLKISIYLMINKIKLDLILILVYILMLRYKLMEYIIYLHIYSSNIVRYIITPKLHNAMQPEII